MLVSVVEATEQKISMHFMGGAVIPIVILILKAIQCFPNTIDMVGHAKCES